MQTGNDSDWTVKAFLLWCMVSPIIGLTGFLFLGSQIADTQKMVTELRIEANKTQAPPVQSVCVRSENKFAMWTGTQEINCQK